MKKSLIFMMLFLVFCVGANAQQYKIAKQVVGSGGFTTTAAGANYKVAGIFGQAFTGSGKADSRTAYVGFWTPTYNTTSVDDNFNVNVGISNYPNPVTNVTNFKFELKEAGYVTINIYNNLGALVAKAAQNEFLPVGTSTIEWNTNVNNEVINNGSYMYELNVVPAGAGNGNANAYTHRNMMIIAK
jgi:hypothetical protein